MRARGRPLPIQDFRSLAMELNHPGQAYKTRRATRAKEFPWSWEDSNLHFRHIRPAASPLADRTRQYGIRARTRTAVSGLKFRYSDP